jgi:transposase-like protein
MRGEILGLERRRRWSDDEKLAIVRCRATKENLIKIVALQSEVAAQI